MVKLAICVKSCHKDMDAGFHDAIRGTWGRDAKAFGVTTTFFVGADPTMQDTRRSRRYQSDEVVQDCPDDYMSLPYKTRRICQWASGKTFDYIFSCDTDTFIRVSPLLTCGFENYDYSGFFHPSNPPFGKRRDKPYTDSYGTYVSLAAWASGGAGYFLSRKAFGAVADTPPEFWAEDMYVGQALAPFIEAGEMKAHALSMESNTMTLHLGFGRPGTYRKDRMYFAYERKSLPMWDIPGEMGRAGLIT